MSDREQYTPGPASGARVKKEGAQKDKDKWTLILVRELRHSPEKVWQALTDPAHLREWAPFVVDGSLGTVGTTFIARSTRGAPRAGKFFSMFRIPLSAELPLDGMLAPRPLSSPAGGD